VTGDLFVGLMSGTSVDAVDCALVRCDGKATTLLATREHEIPAVIRDQIADISHPGANEIERMGQLDRELGRLFADACLTLLESSDTHPGAIRAIGSHGQTIRHHPPSATTAASSAFTLQIADPGTIAELTGITTVTDFRRRDVAAGGQGAPLAPAFHAAAFGAHDRNRAIVNIGGIANVTLLKGMQLVQGFDTGPGNTLLDHWIGRHRGADCDRSGQWAGSGEVDQALLSQLLQHGYFALTGPRSTGKEAFNMAWLDEQLADRKIVPVDVQATLAELTAASIAGAITGSGLPVDEMYVCGGGVHNKDLLQRLQRRMASVAVDSTAALGLDPDWVEAVTFAWLAHRTLEGLPGNAPMVTGAAGERVLGGVYPR
jgi:anhydro-N-acetylmuramic acid kinase